MERKENKQRERARIGNKNRLFFRLSTRVFFPFSFFHSFIHSFSFFVRQTNKQTNTKHYAVVFLPIYLLLRDKGAITHSMRWSDYCTAVCSMLVFNFVIAVPIGLVTGRFHTHREEGHEEPRRNKKAKMQMANGHFILKSRIE